LTAAGDFPFVKFLFCPFAATFLLLQTSFFYLSSILPFSYTLSPLIIGLQGAFDEVLDVSFSFLTCCY